VWPEKYRAVVEQVRSFIMSVEDDNEEEETKKNAKSSSKPPKKGKPQQRRKSVRKIKAKALRKTKT
jgi:hypothetical protein